MRYTFVANGQIPFVDPDYEGRGLGGSEASLVLLTRELARRGHVVEVFNAAEQGGDFNGVSYHQLREFEVREKYDTLVLFRAGHAGFAEAQAERKIFWSTDIDWSDWDQTVFPFVDRTLCMSPYHRGFLLTTYRGIGPDAAYVLGLGIVGSDYFDHAPDELPDKPGNRLIYCSVPERGLAHLDRLFPRIREVVPDAELVITSDYSLWGRAPGNAEYRAALEQVPGIEFHGKVSRQRLVQLQKATKVMAYPCTYHEGFCIAAMECIAAGAVPVTTNDFALRTTVGESGVLLNGKPGEPEYDRQFVEQVVRLLTQPEAHRQLALAGRRRAYQQYRWEIIADRFEELVAGTRPHGQPPGFAPRIDAQIPSIAVVIPVHNQAPYLYRAVASAIWQLGAQDELIVVDDASTDLDAQEFRKEFRRPVLWLRNETKRGVSYSRNRAIERSRADWIKFLDADDVLAPFALDALRQALVQMPAEIQVVTGGCHRMHNGSYHDYLAGAQNSLKLILQANPILPSATFVKREALLAVGLFDERMDFEEDWDLWLRLRERFGLKAFAVTNQPICYYWHHQQERNYKARTYTVDGVPVREYLHGRYGVKAPEGG